MRSLFLAGCIAFGYCTALSAGTLFFSGNLRTDATVTDCGPMCTLGASNTDGDFAQWAAFVTSFTLGSASDVQAITYGYGGGTSVTGPAVNPGGLEPYLTLFDAAGNFVASTFSGTYCPSGAQFFNGQCNDVLLDAGVLAAGTYQIALTAFSNLSFAENLGTGTLADGFTGLGNLFDGESLDFAFDVVTTSQTATPEPATWLLCLAAGSVAMLIRRR